MAKKNKMDIGGNRRTTSPRAAAYAINQMIDLGLENISIGRPVFIWGPPGIGKSEIVEQIAKKRGGASFDMRLTMYDPNDIKGMPYFGKDSDGNDAMMWAPSEELPKDDSKLPDDVINGIYDGKKVSELPCVILFLDEMNQATPSVQAASFQLVLNRRIGRYVLPKNCIIVAAGNRASDQGVTYTMPAPLKNRFTHIYLEPNFEDFRDYALKAGIDPSVMGYLSFRTQDLFNFNPSDDNEAFCTPRSWMMVSDIIKHAEKTGALPDTVLADLLHGTVGSVASMFLEQRKLAKILPDPDKIISGEHKEKLQSSYKDESGERHEVASTAMEQILATTIVHRLNEIFVEISKKTGKENKNAMDAYYKALDNAMTWMKNNFRAEIMVVVIGMIVKTYNMELVPTMLEDNAFRDFISQLGEYLNPIIPGDVTDTERKVR